MLVAAIENGQEVRTETQSQIEMVEVEMTADLHSELETLRAINIEIV